MSLARRRASILPVGIFFFALGQLPTISTSAQKTPETHLSHNDLKRLIETASTREDHLRIAAFYQAEASRLRNDAAEHADLEAAYGNGSRYSPKQSPSAYEHCKYFAESMEHAAQAAEALASAHRTLADQIAGVHH